MNKTPYFPVWRPRLAPMGSAVAKNASLLSQFTLSQLETQFSALPA